MAQQLTPGQAEVLAFIERYQRRHQWAPTRKEISAHFGWSSINAANDKVSALLRKGYLARRAGPHSHRDLIVVKQD